MKFIAFIRQEGQGCDYTIDCGATMIELKAKTVDEATSELKRTIKEEYCGEYSLGEAIIYGIEVSTHIPLDKWYEDFEEEEMTKIKKGKEEKERAIYEKLKKKYEK